MPDELQVTDLISDFINLVQSMGACQEAIDWLQAFVDADPSEKCIKALQVCETDPGFDGSWSFWCIVQTYGFVTAQFRIYWMTRLESPMAAYVLYRDMPTLTDAEYAILRSKFVNELPNAEI
jgi:hypothetical protein